MLIVYYIFYYLQVMFLKLVTVSVRCLSVCNGVASHYLVRYVITTRAAI